MQRVDLDLDATFLYIVVDQSVQNNLSCENQTSYLKGLLLYYYKKSVLTIALNRTDFPWPFF